MGAVQPKRLAAETSTAGCAARTANVRRSGAGATWTPFQHKDGKGVVNGRGLTPWRDPPPPHSGPYTLLRAPV